jgi:hypothetical protein
VFVLSGRGLCVGLITRPEQSYRLRCVSEYNREASTMRRPWPTGGCCTIKKVSHYRHLRHHNVSGFPSFYIFID